MAMSDKTKTVLNYLKEANGANLTAADIAEAVGFPKKSVDGIVTSGLQRKGLAYREPAEIEVTNEEGKVEHKQVKFIKLTDEGMNFTPGVDDVDAAPAE
jgi:Mn-dependent DtxR family transcriptional regulator